VQPEADDVHRVDGLLRVLAAHDEISRIDDLRAAGISSAELRRALRQGAATRVRTGIVASANCAPEIRDAAHVGGRLAGASAARYLGLWHPPHTRLVIEVPRGTHCSTRTAGAVILRGPSGPRRVGCSPASDIVVHVLRTEPLPVAIAIIDSALARGAVVPTDLQRVSESLSRSRRSQLALVDGRSESGTESVVRVALALAGIIAVPQVRIPLTRASRVDLVVGDRLVIECDSRAFHTDPDAVLRDRERDLQLIRLGFLVVRVPYAAAMFDLGGVVSAIQRMTDAGLHLDRAAPIPLDTSARLPRVDRIRAVATLAAR